MFLQAVRLSNRPVHAMTVAACLLFASAGQAQQIRFEELMRFRHSVAPVYPLAAKRAGICGSVRAEIVVNAAGRVVIVNILKADPEGVFEDGVIAAIRKWEFDVPLGMSPETVQRTSTTIKFQLDPDFDNGSTCKAG